MRTTLLQLCLMAIIWPLNAFATDEVNEANARAEQLFERVFEEQVSLSPMYQTHLGRKTHYHQWDDISPATGALYQRLYRDQLQRVKALDESRLNDANQLNRTLLIRDLRQSIDRYRWRDHNYPVNQMFGLHAGVVSFLINSHRVDTRQDAEAYISRLEGVEPLLQQLIDNLERRADKGILAPAFVYPYVVDDSKNIITGAPFSEGEKSPLLADFEKKVEALALPAETQKTLLDRARAALVEHVEPAYRGLIRYVETLAERADSRAGVWKLPDGEQYYRSQLRAITTTELTAETIHQTGLGEVARIHGQMRDIVKTLEFDGSLQEFFAHVKTAPRFYYPDSEAGRQQYLDDTRAIIDAMRAELPTLFGHLPGAKLTVKAVEPYREQSAGKAFYQAPAEDGSRPGIYYVNLHDLSAMPKYQMEALAYHEALPGHHMQIAIAQEMQSLPAFRRHGHYTAYIEGWGLYAERVPKELSFYADPYSDFGRLSFELWRAIRLVVDTGIHHLRWSREEAIDYFAANSPMTRDDATREIERYIVLPGQATAYKVGMNAILQLRERAQGALGEDFDLREFHDLILGQGALPLDVLDDRVEQWIAAQTRTQ